MDNKSKVLCQDCYVNQSKWYSTGPKALICDECSLIHNDLFLPFYKSIEISKTPKNNLINSNLFYSYLERNKLIKKMDYFINYCDRRKFIINKYFNFCKRVGGLGEIFTKNKNLKFSESKKLNFKAKSRLIDYFLVLERGKITSNGENSLLNFVFEPKIAFRYPENNHNDFPLTKSAGLFVFPNGIRLSIRNKNSKQYSFFALTNENGVRQYGVYLTFWVLIRLSDIYSIIFDQKFCKKSVLNNLGKRELYSPRSIVLLSQWPFYNNFKQLLSILYRLSITIDSHPIERQISFIIDELPSPPCKGSEIQFNFGDEIFNFKREPLCCKVTPQVDLSYIINKLSSECLIKLVMCVLFERKVLIISKNCNELVNICEGVLNLICPFVFNGVYIPILPKVMSEILNAPVPFLIGATEDYIEKTDNKIVIFYVNNGEINIPLELELPVIPPKQLKRLKHVLNKNLLKKKKYETSFNLNSKESIKKFKKLKRFNSSIINFNKRENTNLKDIQITNSVEFFSENKAVLKKSDNSLQSIIQNKFKKKFEIIQNCFLNFFATIFGHYEIFFVRENGKVLFKTEEFVSFNKNNSNFLKEITETQSWNTFITNRKSITIVNSTELNFFKIEKILEQEIENESISNIALFENFRKKNFFDVKKSNEDFEKVSFSQSDLESNFSSSNKKFLISPPTYLYESNLKKSKLELNSEFSYFNKKWFGTQKRVKLISKFLENKKSNSDLMKNLLRLKKIEVLCKDLFFLRLMQSIIKTYYLSNQFKLRLNKVKKIQLFFYQISNKYLFHRIEKLCTEFIKSKDLLENAITLKGIEIQSLCKVYLTSNRKNKIIQFALKFQSKYKTCLMIRKTKLKLKSLITISVFIRTRLKLIFLSNKISACRNIQIIGRSFIIKKVAWEIINTHLKELEIYIIDGWNKFYVPYIYRALFIKFRRKSKFFLFLPLYFYKKEFRRIDILKRFYQKKTIIKIKKLELLTEEFKIYYFLKNCVPNSLKNSLFNKFRIKKKSRKKKKRLFELLLRTNFESGKKFLVCISCFAENIFPKKSKISNSDCFCLEETNFLFGAKKCFFKLFSFMYMLSDDERNVFKFLERFQVDYVL